MKFTYLILSVAAAADVFVAIRYRQPMAFILAAVFIAVMVYLYLSSDPNKKSKTK